MGMYTEFHFNSELKEDIPHQVIYILKQMAGDWTTIGVKPDHPLFQAKDQRWQHMFQQDSFYFSADTIATFRYCDIGGNWILCVRCNLKNYENEIEKFIDWIMPFVDKDEGDFLGFSRYEQTKEPTLIYCKQPKREMNNEKY